MGHICQSLGLFKLLAVGQKCDETPGKRDHSCSGWGWPLIPEGTAIHWIEKSALCWVKSDRNMPSTLRHGHEHGQIKTGSFPRVAEGLGLGVRPTKVSNGCMYPGKDLAL